MAIVREISAEHIAPAGNALAFEPQRRYNWTLEITPPASIADAHNFTEVIRLSIVSMPFPQMEVGRVTINFGNEQRHVAGRATFSEEQLTCVDYIDRATFGVLYDWYTNVYDPETGAIGYAYEYKGTADVLFFGPKGEMDPGYTRMWTLYGIWPRVLRPGEGDMNTEAPNQVTVTFSVDRAVYRYS